MSSATDGATDKEKVVSWGFVAFFGLALGWAGVLVAAVAVGLERATGKPIGPRRKDPAEVERAQQERAARRAAAAERAEQWLRDDLAAREEFEERRRRWWADGGKPEDEPRRTGVFQRARDFLQRSAARAQVWRARGLSKPKWHGAWWGVRTFRFFRDFRDGFKEGFDAARQKVDQGWRETSSTRPEPHAEPQAAQPAPTVEPEQTQSTPDPALPTPQAVPIGGGGPGLPFDRQPPPSARREPPSQQPPPQPQEARRSPGASFHGQNNDDFPTNDETSSASSWQDEDTDRDPIKVDAHLGEPATPEGDRMSLPTKVQASTPATVSHGEDLADRLVNRFMHCNSILVGVMEFTDQLSAMAANLRAQATAQAEAAGSDATTLTTQAIDALQAESAYLENLALAVCERANNAKEQVAAGVIGLNPAFAAREHLQAAGGTGDLISTHTGRE